MKRIHAPLAVALGCAVIVVANVLTLGAAMWNRAGGPRAELQLTERELQMPPFREPDDTGILLSFATSDQPPPWVAFTAFRKNRRLPQMTHPWLDEAKLRELGFRIDLPPDNPAAEDRYARTPPRRAYVAFEFDGPAWRSWLAGRERAVEELRAEVEKGLKSQQDLADARALLDLDRVARSRLFPVDAGGDVTELMRRCPERARCVVLPGVVAARIRRPEGQPPLLTGEIQTLLVEDIHVPLSLHAPLLPFLPTITEEQFREQTRDDAKLQWPAASPPRYRATLAIGRRLEPWLLSVAPIEKASAE